MEIRISNAFLCGEWLSLLLCLTDKAVSLCRHHQLPSHICRCHLFNEAPNQLNFMSKITSFVRLLVGVYRLVACTCCCAKLLSSVLGAFSLFAWFPRSSWFLALLACLLVFFCLYFVFCFLLLPWFSPILLRYKLANAPIEIQMQKCTVFLLLHTYTHISNCFFV